MKPVLYLDVDGVLWDIQQRLKDDKTLSSTEDPRTFACAARGLEEFLEYALEKFEMRWCTTWAMNGVMTPQTMQRLEAHTGVGVDTWGKVQPSFGWRHFKSENLNWEEIQSGRPFAWVEDALLQEELSLLRDRGFTDWYYYTDVFEDADALVNTLGKLKERFGT